MARPPRRHAARAAAEALRAEDLVKEAKAAEGDAARLANEAKEKGTPEEAQKAGAAKEDLAVCLRQAFQRVFISNVWLACKQTK